MKSFKSFVWSVSFFLCATPLLAFEYSNAQLGFKAKLPDGLDDFSTNMAVKMLISLGKMDGSKNRLIEMIAIQEMRGTIGRDDLSKWADKPQNMTLEKATWKSFDVDVFRVVENIGGVSYVAFNAQVPLKPHAIQIKVLGPPSDDRRLRTEMQTIVASIEGSSNWLTPEEVNRRPQRNWIAILIGLFILIVGKLRMTRYYGLNGGGARVAGFVIFVAGFVLPRLEGPVLMFVQSYGVSGAGLLIAWPLFPCAVILGVIAVLVDHYGNAYAKDSHEAVPSPATAARQTVPNEVLMTHCYMCQSPIPPEQQRTAKTCPGCGADLTRWIQRRIEPPPLSVPEDAAQDSSFPKQAAKFSLYAPLASFCIGIFVRPQVHGNRMAMIVLGLTSMLLIITALVLGIMALVATKRRGRAGIFGRALVGTCINGLCVLAMLIIIPGLIKAIASAEARRSQRMEQTQQQPDGQQAEEKEATKQARATVQTFIDALKSPGTQMTNFRVRKDFPTPVGVDEEFSLEDVSYDGKVFHGTVINKPVAAQQIKQGDRIAVAPDELSDWWFVDKKTKKLVGGYSLRIWVKHQPPERRKAWEKSLGIESFEVEQL